MRKILFLIILLLPFAAAAADKRKPKNLPVSRWREAIRITPDSSAIVPFTDTTYISFQAKAGFRYHTPNGFIYKGTYTLDNDKLDFGTAHYTILIRKPTELVMANEKGIYHFAVDTADTVKTIVILKEAKPDTVTDIDQMIGHWTVYKRTTKKELLTVDYASEIKTVYITGPSTDGKEGYVYGGPDQVNSPSWYITGLGTDETLECSGKSPRVLKVLKCQQGEMILEENDVKYFFKQFK